MAHVVATGGLYGVGEGVPVVEHRPVAGLAFVGGHHPGLDLHTSGNLFSDVEAFDVLATEEVVLGHLTPAATHLALGEGHQGVSVAEHGYRLPERPHQVLALGQVDARLAADGCVDLGQQGCGHVGHGYAPVVAGCGESGHVGNHSPSDANDQIAPCEAP